MITAVRAQQDCLLSYALSTNPNPLTVSPPDIAPGTEDEHAFADIDLVISNSGSTPVRCSKIAIVLPIGSLAQDLAVTSEGIDAYVSPESGWTIIDVQSDVLLAVPMAETAVFPAAGSAALGSSAVRFDVVPSSGGESEVTVDGLYIHLSGIKVSGKTGIARIGIEEWATDEAGPIPGVANTRTLDVAKFPFRSGGSPDPGIGRALVALTGTGQDPATKIAAGAPVVLEWHHLRGDSHELYADGRRLGNTRPELEQIAGGSRWEILGGLQRDTAIALKTSAPTPTGGNVVRWDHLTVCISDQTLDSLTVSNTLAAKGAVTVGQQNAEATLTVNGPIDAKRKVDVGGDLTVTGKLQANGGLATNSTGETVFRNNVTVYTPATLTVGAGMTVTGAISGSNGTVTVNSILSANGKINALAGLDVTGTLTATVDIKRGGKGVICHNDEVGFFNTWQGEGQDHRGWFYASSLLTGKRRECYIWNDRDAQGNPIRTRESYWKLSRDRMGSFEADPEADSLPAADDAANAGNTAAD